MPPRIAKDFDQKIGTAVDHLGLVGEVGCRIDEASQLDHPHHPIQITTTGGARLRHQAQRAALCAAAAPAATSMSAPRRPLINPSGPCEI